MTKTDLAVPPGRGTCPGPLFVGPLLVRWAAQEAS
jgi:hypothetical protein